MGNDRELEQNDSTFLWTLTSLVIMFILLVFAVDTAYARGGGQGHGRGHGGGHSYGRVHNRHGARHRGYRGHRRGVYSRGYGRNGWDSFGYGFGTGIGIGLVNWIATPRPVIVYDNIQPVIVQERVIIQKPARYTPPPVDYRYHKIIEPEPLWEH